MGEGGGRPSLVVAAVVSRRRRIQSELTSSSRCAAFSSNSCSFQVRRSTLATPTGVGFFFSSALMALNREKRENRFDVVVSVELTKKKKKKKLRE